MIGGDLVTKQTGEKGRPCKKVFVVERRYPRRKCSTKIFLIYTKYYSNLTRKYFFLGEYYFAITMERGAEQFGPVLVGSASGGMNIEEVAATNPEAIIKEHVDMKKGLGLEQAKRMAARMGFAGSSQDEAADYFIKMYNLFVEKVMLQTVTYSRF